MLETTLVTLLFSVGVPLHTEGQEKYDLEVSGGSTLVGIGNLVSGHGIGWVIGGGWHLTPWLTVGAEIDRSLHSQPLDGLNLDAKLLATLAGIHVTTPTGSIRPLAQIFTGQTQISLNAQSDFPIRSTADFFERHGVIQIGGGVDVSFHDRISARVTLSYRRIFSPRVLWQRRFTTAAVYRFRAR